MGRGDPSVWRDAGYAAGALFSGLVAAAFGIRGAVAAVGGLTILSGVFVTAVTREGPGGATV